VFRLSIFTSLPELLSICSCLQRDPSGFSGCVETAITNLCIYICLCLDGQISSVRRDVGALFVEEIGAGGAFQQADLAPSECFLLDSGRRELYMWFGLESTWHCRALCVRVSRAYVRTLTSTNHDPCASALFREVFRLPARQDTFLEAIEAGTERERIWFTHCFSNWTPIGSTDVVVKKLCVVWDMDHVTDDEIDDINIAPDGREIEHVSCRMDVIIVRVC
jgi:hypothetical protein